MRDQDQRFHEAEGRHPQWMVDDYKAAKREQRWSDCHTAIAAAVALAIVLLAIGVQG